MNFIYIYTVMYFFKLVEILIAVLDGKNVDFQSSQIWYAYMKADYR